MLRILLVTLLVPGLSPAFAQVDSVALHYATTITEAGLRNDIDTLASDAYEGRETGMKGQKMAAAYIEARFKSFGIPPVPDAKARGMIDGYRQQYPLEMTKLGGLSVANGDSAFTYMRDFAYFGEELKKDLNTDVMTVTTSFGLAGKMSDLGSPVVMILDQDTNAATWGMVRRLKSIGGAYAHSGAEVVLVEDGQALKFMNDHAGYFNSPRMQLAPARKEEDEAGMQLVVISPAMAQAILKSGGSSLTKAMKKVATKTLHVKAPLRFGYKSLDEKLIAENVLGYVEGSDRKEELVVVTAHYDHLGVKNGEVYNGADDDGSGTVAVLAMARAFAMAKMDGHGPRRSMLFMTVSGEEEGLLGSEWYSDHPVFPLGSTVVDLNTDMIGRVDTAHRRNDRYVYVIGSGRLSSELQAITEKANATYTKLDLDYTYDTDSDPNRYYYRSDHYNFAKHGIPIAFFFNGVHEDYHGPHDEVDKIRFDLLHQRALLVFHTAWVVANRNDRIVVDHPVPAGE